MVVAAGGKLGAGALGAGLGKKKDKACTEKQVK